MSSKQIERWGTPCGPTRLSASYPAPPGAPSKLSLGGVVRRHCLKQRESRGEGVHPKDICASHYESGEMKKKQIPRCASDWRKALGTKRNAGEGARATQVLIPLALGRRLRSSIEYNDLVGDRKSTRLNSSHRCISYAVFCLKKKTAN